MRSCDKKLCLVVLLGFLANGAPLMSVAQTLGQSVGSRSQPAGPDEPPDPATIKMQQRQLKSLNALRQKRLVADADKLLRLAAELNAEVSHPEKAPISATSIQKVDEIEKLAKRVRDKMKEN